MAAVLACGDGAVLSHESASALWAFRQTNTGSEGQRAQPELIHVSVPPDRVRRLEKVRVHRRARLEETECTEREGIPIYDAGAHADRPRHPSPAR